LVRARRTVAEPYYGGAIRDEKPFVWNDTITALQVGVLDFLAANKVVPSNKLFDGAIDDSLARAAMSELHVSSPLITLRAVPLDVGYPLVQDPSSLNKYVKLFA